MSPQPLKTSPLTIPLTSNLPRCTFSTQGLLLNFPMWSGSQYWEVKLSILTQSSAQPNISQKYHKMSETSQYQPVKPLSQRQSSPLATGSLHGLRQWQPLHTHSLIEGKNAKSMVNTSWASWPPLPMSITTSMIELFTNKSPCTETSCLQTWLNLEICKCNTSMSDDMPIVPMRSETTK
jgi:hypothetical protein